ncbi:MULTISPECIES: DUF4124 domain-containing protein [Rhodanobacteraceae]|uniref:DUF4124 domain-containing protein n=1 Tax=Rhodanobacteraceae TaxID=1775411 RepID=UPI001592715B|nr:MULTISPECIES: DUF4124 domain-containing protein [Rhodanobacteraceae]
MFIAFVTVSCGATAQSVYKWTDPQGVAHYTDQPPPSGNAARIQLKTRSEPVSPADAGGGPGAGITSSATPSALATAEAAAQKRNCERSRNNLSTLSSGAMLVDSSNPNTAKRLDEAQIAEAKRAAEADVAAYCGAGNK